VLTEVPRTVIKNKVVADQGPVSQKPWKLLGPVKPWKNLEPYNYRAVLFTYF